jgi:glutamate---cysteine ligase / carboxylate-amine ligase
MSLDRPALSAALFDHSGPRVLDPAAVRDHAVLGRGGSIPEPPGSGAAFATDDEAATDFCDGGEFTVGAEDELLLVDSLGQMLGARGPAVVEQLQRMRPVAGTVSGEVFADEVEFGTPVCADAEGVLRSLAILRRSVATTGASALAVGLHPSAPFGEACLGSSPRYALIADELAGLLRTPTAAFQVHVGLPDADTAMLAYRGLRNRLFVLRALAAGSPHWHGRDSGLASARSAVIASYPRVSAPPALRHWEHYLEVNARVIGAAGLPDYTYVWWDLRPQPRLGTMEVRVMDAQPSLARAAGLAALVQGLARHAVEVPDLDDLPGDVLAANDFRASRYGLDTTVVDRDGTVRHLREVAVRALVDARRMLAADGLDRPLDAIEAALIGPSEADRQRRIQQQHGIRALVDDLVTRTSDPDF